MLFRQKLSVLTVLIVVVFLVGCAPSRVNIVPPLSQGQEANFQQGVVVARVIDAGGVALPFNQFTLVPDNFNETNSKVKVERLISLEPDMNGATIFGSYVTPGNYSLSDIRAFYRRGEYWYSRFVESNVQFGTFKVEPGKVTDLGTIIFYPKPQGEYFVKTLVRLPEEKKAEILNKHFPFFKFDPAAVITWAEDDADEERMSAYASIAQNPVSFTKYKKMKSGNIYFLGKLGVILKRNTRGEWLTDAVDTNLDLSSILEMANGDLWVSSFDGRLFRKRKNHNWQEIKVENVAKIHEIGEFSKDFVDLIITSGDYLKVLRSPAYEINPNWEVINEYSYETFWKNTDIKMEKGPKSLRAAKEKLADQIRVNNLHGEFNLQFTVRSKNSSSVFIDGSKEKYRFDPETWSVTSYQSDNDINLMSLSGERTIGIEEPGFWSWSGRRTYYVKDEDQWKEMSFKVKKCEGKIAKNDLCDKSQKSSSSSFEISGLPWFFTKAEALVIAEFSDFDFWSGKRTEETKILKTEDSGMTWVDTENKLPREYCKQIIHEVNDRWLLGCNGATGDFFESLDQGKTWNHVRQHENF